MHGPIDCHLLRPMIEQSDSQDVGLDSSNASYATAYCCSEFPTRV
jgi:hypothetical protein